MRLTKSLLAIAAAVAFAGTAFAEDSYVPEEEALYTEEELLALEEEQMTIYPLEVTEYYLIVPDDADDIQPNG